MEMSEVTFFFLIDVSRLVGRVIKYCFVVKKKEKIRQVA
jgi:hypothetical protein